MRPGRPESAQLDEIIGPVAPVETCCSYTVEFGCSYLAWFCCSYFVQFYCFADGAGENKSCASLMEPSGAVGAGSLHPLLFLNQTLLMRSQYGVRGEDSTVPWVSADGCPLGQADSYLA